MKCVGDSPAVSGLPSGNRGYRGLIHSLWEMQRGGLSSGKISAVIVLGDFLERKREGRERNKERWKESLKKVE